MWALLALSLIAPPPPTFVDAVAVSVSASGTVHVLDAGASELLVWTGSEIRRAGWRGTRRSDVDASHDLSLFVADPDARRILRLDRHLSEVSAQTSERDRFDRIAVNRYRELFAVDSKQRILRKFRPNGEPDPAFDPPRVSDEDLSDVAVSGDAVLIGHGRIVRVLDRFGLETAFREFPEPVRRIASRPDGVMVLAGDSIHILDASWRIVERHSVEPGCVDVAWQHGQVLLLYPKRLKTL